MSVTLVTMVTFRGFRVLCLENILNLSTYGNVRNLEKINMIIHLMRVNSSDQTCADT